MGYTITKSPVQLIADPESRYVEEYRDLFFMLALLSVLIMPISRPASQTKLLWYAQVPRVYSQLYSFKIQVAKEARRGSA